MPKKPLPLAKLSRPRLFDALPRARLFTALDELRSHPAIWVAGPPGAGKTTLVASYIEATGIPHVWYQLDATDADPASLFYYLSLADGALPNRSGKVPKLPLLTPEHLADVAGFSRRFFRQLYARMESASVLVFDNFQDAGDQPGFHEIFRVAIENVPQDVNIVLISRLAPPDSYAHLVANQSISQMHWEALRLSREESAQIAELHVPIDARQVDLLHERSQGWAAGLILLAHRMRRDPGQGAFLAPDSLHEVFAYFAGQLFEQAVSEDRTNLLMLGYLPNITSSMAESLTGDESAFSLVEDLYRRQLFTDRRRDEEPTYQFHAMFRAFLQHRARFDLSESEQDSVLRKAAGLLEARGHFEDAMNAWVQSTDWAAARKLIVRNASGLMAQGRWRTVLNWIETVPDALLSQDDWLQYWQGVALSATDPEGARARLQSSFELAERGQDVRCMISGAAEIVGTYMAQYTHFRPLDRWIAVLQRFAPGSHVGDEEDELRLESAFIFALGVRQQSDPTLLAPRIERVLEMLDSTRNANLVVTAATRLVLYASSTGPIDIGSRVLPRLEPLLTRPEVTPFNAAWGHAAISWFHCLSRNVPQCLAACSSLERIAESEQLPFVGKLATINRLWAALFDYDVAAGRKLLAKLEELSDSTQPYDRASCHGARSWIALCENNLSTAHQEAIEAIRIFDESGSTMHRVNFRLLLVISFFKKGDFDSSRAWLAEMRQISGEGITSWQRCSLLMWDAIVARAEGKDDRMREMLQASLLAGQELGGEFMLMNWCGPWLPDLLGEALSADIESEHVVDLVRRFGIPSPSEHVEAWPWPVRVFTLGQFKVEVGGSTLEFPGKSPRKLFELLKVLIALGGNDVPEEQITDLLWAEQDGDAAHQSFTIALHRLRRLLGIRDCILHWDGKVSINASKMWIDAVAFDALSADADQLESGRMRLAVAMYGGEFLKGQETPWSFPLRERLRVRFRHLVLAAARRLEYESQFEQALDLYRAGIKSDEFAENFYQGLMRCHHEMGRTPEAIEAYRLMSELLGRTGGMNLSRATEELYRKLAGD